MKIFVMMKILDENSDWLWGKSKYSCNNWHIYNTPSRAKSLDLEINMFQNNNATVDKHPHIQQLLPPSVDVGDQLSKFRAFCQISTVQLIKKGHELLPVRMGCQGKMCYYIALWCDIDTCACHWFDLICLQTQMVNSTPVLEELIDLEYCMWMPSLVLLYLSGLIVLRCSRYRRWPSTALAMFPE